MQRCFSSSPVTSAEKKRKIVVIGAGFVGEPLKRITPIHPLSEVYFLFPRLLRRQSTNKRQPKYRRSGIENS